MPASGSAALGAEPVAGDIGDATSLRAALEGCTHVVHLVALIKGRPAEFQAVMTDGTKSLVAAAREAGVERFVLMSALGAAEPTPETVPYFRAKWAMEQEVKGAGLGYTIFRPSFVFGNGGALPTFVAQVRYSPLVTVIGNGRQRSQPIWVDDVAAYVAKAIDNAQAANKTFELGGPDTVDWDGLYRLIAKVLGKRRALIHVPFAVAGAGARLDRAPTGRAALGRPGEDAAGRRQRRLQSRRDGDLQAAARAARGTDPARRLPALDAMRAPLARGPQSGYQPGFRRGASGRKAAR